jgi:hypothetical protein
MHGDLMHGMVNRALQGFIVTNCGPAVWEEVRSIRAPARGRVRGDAHL